jgi:hypothetical protein
MRCSFRLLLVVLAFLTVDALATVAKAATTPVAGPFIERVRPDDYFDVEKGFPEPFSRAHEFVILRTTAAKPVSVFAIEHAATGDGYTMTVELASASAPDGWLKISDDLDAAVGRQVLRAVELKLHRQVSLSDFKRVVSKTDTDIWVYLRLSDNHVAAALLSSEAAFGNSQASAFIDDFLGSLEQLVGKEGAERNALLEKIDRTATAIILAESR